MGIPDHAQGAALHNTPPEGRRRVRAQYCCRRKGPDSADPAVIVAARGGLRLGLIAALQYLPPRQRAVLVLRDVLAFPATEVAVMLGTTTASVKSALQRARAQLEERAPASDEIPEPNAPRARALLSQYMAAFENADAAALERLLLAD